MSKEKIIIVVLLIVIVVIVGVGGLLLLKNKEQDLQEPPVVSSTEYKYDANIVLDDPVALQQKVDEMLEKVQEGQMSIEMQTEADSTDGENFSCYIANSLENSYDMFIIIYEDDTQEEIYRSGLIPTGGRIESFSTSKKFGSGNHTCTITFVQVEEDLSTIHAQVNIGLELNVK